MAYPTDPIYKEFKNVDGRVTCILTEKRGLVLSIPLSEDNVDYREYKEWVAQGNTAEAAD
tara:strand:+ start:338 stop:517 length:180 start_codon:yes stop_codon:yes gene_type:complete